ncbi:MAG: hypothetical protein PGN13_14375 [Patulibacter minatonensis]
MRSPAPRTLITAAFIAVAAALLTLSPYALLVMLPALVIAWIVLIGAFTGERAIAYVRRVAARLLAARPTRTPRAVLRRPPRRTARGGLLLARALASRPPPTFA